MTKITRSEVVERAENAFKDGGYFWGGDYRISSLRVSYQGENSNYVNPYGNNSIYGNKNFARYPVVPDSSSNIIGTDCSGFCGWAWALSSKHGSGAWSSSGKFGSNFRARSSYNHNESDFHGIQQGDVLWRQGHVALYIGNNTVLEFTTKEWSSTGNKRGGWRRTIAESEYYKSWVGYCSYDNTYSSDYDEESENPDTFSPSGGGSNSDLNGVTDGAINNIDTSSGIDYLYIYNSQYTKRYSLMKHYRR